MSAIYFKDDNLNIYILISYKESKDMKSVILQEIKFFKEKIDVTEYIKHKDLNLIPQSELMKASIISKLKNLIEEYLSGQKINLLQRVSESNIELDLETKFSSEFSQKVLSGIISINYGDIASYSDIGDKMGSKAYRAVGSVLKKNPLPLIVPCHRVIKKNGSIGGFMGKIDDDDWEQKLKMNLLNLERQGS